MPRNQVRDYVSDDLLSQFDGPIPPVNSLVQVSTDKGMKDFNVFRVKYKIVNGESWAIVLVSRLDTWRPKVML